MKKNEIQGSKFKILDCSDNKMQVDLDGQGILNLESNNLESKNSPVVCLGMEFPNDEARRSYFLDKLREFLADPEFRKIEGFPIGRTKTSGAVRPAILHRLPEPVHCRLHQALRQALRPEQAVQPRAVRCGCERGQERPDLQRPLLSHQGAAQSHHAVHPPLHRAGGHGLRWVLRDGHDRSGGPDVRRQGDGRVAGLQGGKDGRSLSGDRRKRQNGLEAILQTGARRAVLNDLSPVATFIAYNYNTPVDVDAFEREAKRILKEVRKNVAGCMRHATLMARPRARSTTPSGRMSLFARNAQRGMSSGKRRWTRAGR